jgi:hypothetical protein
VTIPNPRRIRAVSTQIHANQPKSTPTRAAIHARTERNDYRFDNESKIANHPEGK